MIGNPPRRAWVEQVMGLPVSVHLRGPAVREPTVADRVAAAFAELRRADAMFSTYRPDSEVSRLNRGELSLADASPEMREVVALCAQARRYTEGWFDARLPDPAGGGRRYDPSGLVKTWAVERAVALLTDLDGHDLCLNAGGDVLVSTAAGHPPWRVGVEDPFAPGRLLRVLTVADGAVATSGDAHRGAHVVDPYTGRPATALRAVTVVGPELLRADVLATAAFARGDSAVEWLTAVDGYEALAVDRHGVVHTTPGWPAAADARHPESAARRTR